MNEQAQDGIDRWFRERNWTPFPIQRTVRLQWRTNASLRLPCFRCGNRRGVLPAFGSVAGTHLVLRRPGDRLFVVAADRVLAVPV